MLERVLVEVVDVVVRVTVVSVFVGPVIVVTAVWM